ncbi:hypothetical protein, partial [Furfurilactobacillus entadae]|uniref:hypothetical protein n=1 Tax=Furfurilactobacillus entadae TaxID=2922307 RepID=UPI0038B3C294
LPDRSHDWARERFLGTPGMSKQEAMAYDVERHQEIIQRGGQEQGFYSAPFKIKGLPSTRPFEPVLPGLTAITSANENEK